MPPPPLFGIFENCFITAGQNLDAPLDFQNSAEGGHLKLIALICLMIYLFDTPCKNAELRAKQSAFGNTFNSITHWCASFFWVKSMRMHARLRAQMLAHNLYQYSINARTEKYWLSIFMIPPSFMFIDLWKSHSYKIRVLDYCVH